MRPDKPGLILFSSEIHNHSTLPIIPYVQIYFRKGITELESKWSRFRCVLVSVTVLPAEVVEAAEDG